MWGCELVRDACANLGLELAKTIFGEDLPFNKSLIDEVTERIRNRARKLKIKNNMTDSEASRMASEQIQREYDNLSKKRQQQAKLDAFARAKFESHVGQFKSKSRGIFNKIAGGEGPEFGVGNSINAQFGATYRRLLSSPDGLLTMLQGKNELGEDLRSYLLNLNNEEKIISEKEGVDTGDPRAKEVARIISHNQEFQRKILNRFGADIKPLEDRISMTIHDPYELSKYDDSFFKDQLTRNLYRLERGAAWLRGGQEAVEEVNDKFLRKSFNRWHDFIHPKLNIERTFTEIKPEASAIKEQMWEDYKSFVSGLHETKNDLSHVTGIDSEVAYTQRAALEKKINSRHRTYHFNDGKDWIAYQYKMGRATLAQTLDRELHQTSNDLALLQETGPTGLRYLEKRIKEEASKEKTQSAKLYAFSSKRLITVMDGSSSRVVNTRMAKIGQNLRDFARMETLGFSTLHSFSDVANEIATLKYNGVTFGDRWATGVKNFIAIFPSKERRQVLDSMVVSTKSLTGAIASRYTPDQSLVGAGYSRLQSQYFNLNGQHPWDWERMGGISAELGRRLALNRNIPYGKLNIDLQKSLADSAIGEREWDAIRQSGKRLADKKLYILADSVRELPDSVIKDYINNPKASKSAINLAKIDLEDLVTKHFFNAEQHVVPFPGLKERALAASGGPKGTIPGELSRFFFQFKTFPFAFVDRVIKRELIGGVNRTPFNVLGGMAELMVGVSIFSGIGLSAAALLKGETVPDFTKEENIKRLLAPAFGLYGDFFMGNYFSYGHSIMDFLKGPVASKFDQIGKDINFSKPGLSALKIGRDLTPNLWFMHALFKNVLYSKFAESLDPGSTARANSRLKSGTGQTIWVQKLFQ
ncbi:hypothetical protein LCGC14_0432770 [marine sediment metagenome]|uniref:Large polyvalent protein associated domain-containing protein n=1 Tax=marine sediment metagenome TaxID=412755 RepID=A0A0F9T5Q8_9ZZZZ